MREDRAVLEVTPVEFGGTAGSVSSEGHIFRSIETLVARTVELTAETACLVIAQP